MTALLRVSAVVDDDPVMRAVLRAMLRTSFDVREYCDGRAFLDAVLGGDDLPDVVILDVMLPGMSGVEVLRALRDNDQTRSVPVLMLTADHQPSTALAALAAGFSPFHFQFEIKPITRRALLAALGDLCGD